MVTTKSAICFRAETFLFVTGPPPFRRCPVINSVFGRLYRKTVPREGIHEGLIPRNDVLTNGFRFSLARILFVPRLRPPLPPPKPRRRCEPEAGYLECSKRFDHRSDSIIFSLFEFKSVDDVGAGKLREMLTLHTNPHAVHGRFTLGTLGSLRYGDYGLRLWLNMLLRMIKAS